MKNKLKISIVIPCHNEEKNIKRLYKEIKNVFNNNRYIIEVIFIDDGSSDNTYTEILKIKKNNDDLCINALKFSRNFGKDAAMYAGLERATGDYITIIDADLQQHPKLIQKMANYLDKNYKYDCVCYYQEKRIENKFISYLKNKFYDFMTKISDIEFVNGASDFRMFRNYVVKEILKLNEKNRFSKGIFSWVGFKTYYMPYTPNERKNGNSNFNMNSLFKYAISGIVSFSVMPLKIATYSGLFFSLISFIYLFIVLFQKIFFTIRIPGYATLIACILLIGGLILFCIGIIGEYLARVYLEVKNRPIYVLKEEFKDENKK